MKRLFFLIALLLTPACVAEELPYTDEELGSVEQAEEVSPNVSPCWNECGYTKLTTLEFCQWFWRVGGSCQPDTIFNQPGWHICEYVEPGYTNCQNRAYQQFQACIRPDNCHNPNPF